MRRALVSITVVAFVYCSGCDGSSSSGSPSGSGGTAGTGGAPSGGTAGTSGGGTGGTASGGGGAGGTTSTGSGGGLLCPDPSNPLFGSCIEPFLAGCYEPDLDGTCTQENGNIMWSDGSKYVVNGPMPGLYGPGDAQPCISVVISPDTITATKGNEVLLFESDQATQTATITCPDSSQVTGTFEQVTNFNRCTGVNCP